MGRYRDTEAEVQRLREDLDSMRNLLELAGILEPAEEPDTAAGASDTGGESENGQEAGDSTAEPPAPDTADAEPRETAVDVTAENRETRED